MTQRNWPWEAKQLLPHLVTLLGKGVTVSGGGGGLVAHALDSGWHTGTLETSQAPWATTDAEFASHTGAADAHHPRLHSLSDAAAHSGALPWAWLDKAGSSLGELTTRNYSQLNGRTHSITGGDHSIAGAQYQVVGATASNTLGLLTPLDSVNSSTTALLKATNGALTLDALTASTRLRSPLLDTASGALTLGPAGAAVLPTGSIVKDLGDYNRKWRTLFAAELYVETLVAQDVLATIGGRVMVAPTTRLIADAASNATTIDVEHNNLNGAYLYLASAPGGMAQVEVMKVTAGPTTISGGYRYTVTRNVDGSGANAWAAGDAVCNIGAGVGQGWIDLTSTSTVRNHLGPTITIYVRTGTAAWTDVKPTVTMGNLRSFVDYGTDEYGLALGNDLTLTPTTGFSGMTGDRVDGLRLFNTDIQLYTGSERFVWITRTEGVGLKVGAAFADIRAYSFSDAGGVFGGLKSYSGASNRVMRLEMSGSSAAQYQTIEVRSTNAGSKGAQVVVQAEDAGVNFGALLLTADLDNANRGTATLQTNTLYLQLDSSTMAAALVNSNYLSVDGEVRTTTLRGLSGSLAVASATSFAAGVTIAGTVSAGSGNLVLDYSATRRGFAAYALPSSTWAWGLSFVNASDSIMGMWGAYGPADALTYLYAGVNYGDYTLRIDPATDRVGIGATYAPSYTLDVNGTIRTTGLLSAVTVTASGTATGATVNATGSYQRDGVRGGLFVPVSARYLTDTGGVVWNAGSGRNVGSYVFDMQAAANGSIPTDALAVLVVLGVRWSVTGDGVYAGAYGVGLGGSGTSIAVRSTVSGITSDDCGLVRLGTNGDIQVDIAAQNATLVYLRLIGYFT